MDECGKSCEVYSRVVGYFRPVQNWDEGKQAEFNERVEFKMDKSLESEHGNAVKIDEIGKLGTAAKEAPGKAKEKEAVLCECKS